MKRLIVLLLLAACSQVESQEMAHKRVDLVEFKQVLTKEGIQLVDVRTPG